MDTISLRPAGWEKRRHYSFPGVWHPHPGRKAFLSAMYGRRTRARRPRRVAGELGADSPAVRAMIRVPEPPPASHSAAGSSPVAGPSARGPSLRPATDSEPTSPSMSAPRPYPPCAPIRRRIHVGARRRPVGGPTVKALRNESTWEPQLSAFLAFCATTTSSVCSG